MPRNKKIAKAEKVAVNYHKPGGRFNNASVRKPTSKRGIRAQRATVPTVYESARHILLTRGTSTSPIVNAVMESLYLLKRNRSDFLKKRRHDIKEPFDHPEVALNLLQKRKSQFWIHGSHTKKRPHRLILGRTFESEFLDYAELLVNEFSPEMKNSVPIDSVNMVSFRGPEWEEVEELKTVKGLLIDLLRPNKLENLARSIVSSMWVVTAIADNQISLSRFQVKLRTESTLQNIGPNMICTLGRVKPADPTVLREAMAVPAASEETIGESDTIGERKLRRNVSVDIAGRVQGRLYVQRQDIKAVNRRFKPTEF